ncbi:hypothetical protein CHUAL_001928 [Chamberlinius hualienensis]
MAGSNFSPSLIIWIITLAINTIDMVPLFPVLNCTTYTPVNCGWFLNHEPVAIDAHNQIEYVYNNKNVSADCSIQLKDYFNPRFNGTWTCWSQSTDSSEGFKMVTRKFRLNDWLDIRYKSTTIDESPKSVNVTARFTVVLNCRFGASLSYHWLRNGQPLDIFGRYRKINHEEGLYSTDSSIEITNVQKIDEGEWICATYGNGDKGYKQTAPAIITVLGASEPNVDHKLTTSNAVVTYPEHQETAVGSSFIIHCLFQRPVKCAWFLNGRLIKIHYRLSYSNYTEGYQSYSHDCSIKISNVKWTDFGNWTCSSQGNHSHVSVKSNYSLITEIKRLHKITLTPRDEISAKLKDDVNIFCKNEAFNGSHCFWLRNNSPVLIHGRYSYSSKGSNLRDCSIKIIDFKPNDKGRWECQLRDLDNNVIKYITNIKIVEPVVIQNNVNSEPVVIQNNVNSEPGIIQSNVNSEPGIIQRIVGSNTTINSWVKTHNDFNKSNEYNTTTVLTGGPYKCSDKYILSFTILCAIVAILAILAAVLLWVNNKSHNDKEATTDSAYDIEDSKTIKRATLV